MRHKIQNSKIKMTNQNLKLNSPKISDRQKTIILLPELACPVEKAEFSSTGVEGIRLW